MHGPRSAARLGAEAPCRLASESRLSGAPPLALGALIQHEGVGYLDHIVTVPEARRRGYGTAMVLRIVAVAQADGAEHVTLLADRGGKPEELYRGLGFADLGYLGSSVRKR